MEEVKYCSHCDQTLPASEFFIRKGKRGDRLQAICKKCRAKMRKDWYAKNRVREISKQKERYGEKYHKDPEAWNAQRRKFRKELRQKVLDKLGNKCAQCGNDDPLVLQVDHVHGGGNKHRQQRGTSHGSTNKYLREILADTDGNFQLLCANCNVRKYRLEQEQEENAALSQPS